MNKPKYQHDCSKCIFLDHIDNHDLYACVDNNQKIKTVIARYSDDGPDYISGLIFAETEYLLKKALELAKEKGYSK